MDRDFRRTALLLGLATWCLYAAMSAGHLSIDPFTRYTVAEQLVRHGTVALEGPTQLSIEHDGRDYSVFFPGQTVVLLPVAAAVETVGAVAGLSNAFRTTAGSFVSCTFVMPLLGALAVLGHVALARQLGVGRRIALASGAVLAFGTPMWIWCGLGSEELALAAIAAWSFWLLLDGRRIAAGPDAGAARRLVDRFGLAGVLLALGLIHRSTFVSVAFGAVVLAAPATWRHRRLLASAWPRAAGWGVAIALVLSIVPLYNLLRFGDPLEMGYGSFHDDVGGLWANPLLAGLAGHLVSPGKSIFLYAPWLILLPIALVRRTVRRRLGPLLPAVALAVAAHLVIYSLHTYWTGAFGWGIRFHVGLLPLVTLPIALLLDRMRMTAWSRAGLVALASLSLAVQGLGLSLNMGLEHFQHPEFYRADNPLIPDEAAWSWRGNQIGLRVVNIARKLRGEPLELHESQPYRPIVLVWNLFPIRAAIEIENRRLLAGLWTLWGLLVAGGLAATGWTAARARRLEAPAAGRT